MSPVHLLSAMLKGPRPAVIDHIASEMTRKFELFPIWLHTRTATGCGDAVPPAGLARMVWACGRAANTWGRVLRLENPGQIVGTVIPRPRIRMWALALSVGARGRHTSPENILRIQDTGGNRVNGVRRLYREYRAPGATRQGWFCWQKSGQPTICSRLVPTRPSYGEGRVQI